MKGSVNVPGLPWKLFKRHTDDKNNPHTVTKAQVGLGKVDNTSDMEKPVSTAQATAIKEAMDAANNAQKDNTAHANNKDNPHGVTKAQVGLGNVDNTSDADKPVSTPQATAIARAVTDHNVSTASHEDIRLLIIGLTNRLNALADSDDVTLDQMSEVVAYIRSNKSLIDSITTSKVNVADIINNLVTNVANKPLSAAQGVVLKGLIDSLTSVKVNVADIINNLTTEDAKKPLSAAQGVALNSLINSLSNTLTSLNAALSQLSTSFSSHNHRGDRIAPGFIELGNTSAVHGGYMDFHYGVDNSDYEDYSTRLIEYGPGNLAFEIQGGSGYYRLYSEYHKPKGSYIGNGSETSRTIEVGGLVNNASLLVITTNTGYIVFVGLWGAVAYRVTDGYYEGFYSNVLNFQDGVLKIASASETVNAAGSNYYYQVL